MTSPEPPPPPPPFGSRSDPHSNPKMAEMEGKSPVSTSIQSAINISKQQVAEDRSISVKERFERNKQKVVVAPSQHLKLAPERSKNIATGENTNTDLLTKRMNERRLNNGIPTEIGFGAEEENDDHPIKLSDEVKKLRPSTTWIYLDRNQKPGEEKSTAIQKKMYDRNGGEVLVCSDSEDEKNEKEEEEEQREFNKSEDNFLKRIIKKHGLSDAVLEALAQNLSRKPDEIKERYKFLVMGEIFGDDVDDPLDKDLDSAMDSLDSLFCRRCLVSDCKLHGCSQDLIFPAQKQLPWNNPDEENEPCGLYCYQVSKSRGNTMDNPILIDSDEESVCPSSAGHNLASSSKRKRENPKAGRGRPRKKPLTIDTQETIHANPETSDCRNWNTIEKSLCQRGLEIFGKSSCLIARNSMNGLKTCAEVNEHINSSDTTDEGDSKDGKNETKVFDCKLHGCSQDLIFPAQKQFPWNNPDEENEPCGPYCYQVSKSRGNMMDHPILIDSDEEPVGPSSAGHNLDTQETIDANPETSDCRHWNTIEKSLCQKGLEIFGKSSCLIARNMMNGMKTCAEVYKHFNSSHTTGEGGSKDKQNGTTGNESGKKQRFVRRRGKARRLKFTSKSAGKKNSQRKRTSDEINLIPIQYHPCACKSVCGKECTCLVNNTYCEKYCGCPKTCNNHYKGCHCIKGQCRNGHCPCFIINRECDPDVCKNCSIVCGDGSLGSSSQRGGSSDCRNMNILLKQKQRVLLGISDVSGWGLFLKNSVEKNDYIGEYTGEVISHEEADRRGKKYDRENRSFLFNLNNEWAIDALRMGNKLKFANHSYNPNCYAKVMLVMGEHRIGIYAKERINAGEELFFDYHYVEDKRPDWAKPPEESSSKKQEAGPSRGRPRKQLAQLKIGSP